jgi:hypothetical protein
VTPLPNITVAFDIINLLGNPLRRYRQYDTGDSFARQVLYIERAYSLGVRFRSDRRCRLLVTRPQDLAPSDMSYTRIRVA